MTILTKIQRLCPTKNSAAKNMNTDVCALPRTRNIAALAATAAVLIAIPVVAEEPRNNYNQVPMMEQIVVGAIKDSTNVEYVDSTEDLKIPELPVTYESEEG